MRNQSKIKDLTGQKFNHLTPVKIVQHNPVYWLCRCDCGNFTTVLSSNITGGKVKSCGCIHHRGNPKHGHCHTRQYRIYAKIKRRCFVENDPAYKDYGGRGITMCDEWRESFEAFYEWSVNNGYSDDRTIDRIDNDGNYCPENCRWADKNTQANNTRANRYITIGDKTHTLSEWSKICGVPYKRVWVRIKSGWSVIDALSYDKDARIYKKGDKT